LARFDRPKIHCVVRLQNKNEWTTLTDLDRLRWNKACIFDDIENQTNPHKFRRPKRVVRIWRHPTHFHGSRAGLDCGVDGIQIAETPRNFFSRGIRLSLE